MVRSSSSLASAHRSRIVLKSPSLVHGSLGVTRRGRTGGRSGSRGLSHLHVIAVRIAQFRSMVNLLVLVIKVADTTSVEEGRLLGRVWTVQIKCLCLVIANRIGLGVVK